MFETSGCNGFCRLFDDDEVFQFGSFVFSWPRSRWQNFFPQMATRLYIGNLPGDVRREEIEGVFDKYGRIRGLDIKGGREPGSSAFCFLEFGEPCILKIHVAFL